MTARGRKRVITWMIGMMWIYLAIILLYDVAYQLQKAYT